MSKKLTKHGNSLALVIDKPLLRLLSITEKTDLEISIENGALIIRPAEMQATRRTHEIKKIAQEIMEEYGDVFKKLAE